MILPIIRFLPLRERQRTSAPVADLFDMRLRALRQERAARIGPELFLYERAFEDCLDRLVLIQRHFDRALLIGCVDAGWPDRLLEIAKDVRVSDLDFRESELHYDLILSVGTLDTINELPQALRLIHHKMNADALFIGALSGGDTLPRLRAAMRAADAKSGVAAPHVHPRIEASALAPLLADAGFVHPVVDVDRASVSYPSLERLVGDLRAMGATNMLTARPRFVGRRFLAEAARAFAEAGSQGRTIETFEIIHFAAWTPKER